MKTIEPTTVEAAAEPQLALERTQRLLAALSATNDVILRARSVDELYQQACEAAIHGGRFITAAVLLPVDGGQALQTACVSGVSQNLNGIRLTTRGDSPFGNGLAASAWRDRRSCISNQAVSDDKLQAWHERMVKAGIRSGAGVPMLDAELGCVGVLLLYSPFEQAFDHETVRLLERIAANIVFCRRNLALAHDRVQQAQELLRFRTAIDTSGDAVYLVDPRRMCLLDVNATACRETGYAREEMLAMPLHHLLHATPEVLAASYESVIAGGAHVDVVTSRPKDGRLRIVELHRRALQTPDGWLIVSIARDVTVRHREERLLAMEHSVTRNLAQNGSMEDALRAVIRDICHHSSWRSGAYFARESEEGHMRFLAGWTAAAARGADDGERRHTGSIPPGGMLSHAVLTGKPAWVPDINAADFAWASHTHWRTSVDMQSQSRLVMPIASNGRVVGVIAVSSFEGRQPDERLLQAMQVIADQIGQFIGRNHAERVLRESEARFQHLATHDTLTGLPNRGMFAASLTNALEIARQRSEKLALLFVDLDRFKVINDTLGHDAGDGLLEEMAARLKRTIRSTDLLARLGGDEFVVMVPHVGSRDEPALVARRVLDVCAEPMMLAGHECRVSASVGFSLFPDDAADEQTLMKAADIAMYAAKQRGRNRVESSHRAIEAPAMSRLKLESRLRLAVERRQFALHYQPKVSLATGLITGAEALIRWTDDELGSVPPVAFIPLAEELGLIVPIGRWVLRTACAQNMAWRSAGLPPVTMAVNLSVRQLGDEHLLSDLDAALLDTGMDGESLELEITETTIVRDLQRVAELLQAIKRRGVRLAIDDFGTGYSSLGQLKRLPVDTLKIDRSFVSDIPDDADDMAITAATIAMGKALRLHTVAEGVETELQEDFLRAHGCDEMQGYLISKPVPPEVFVSMWRDRLARAVPKLVA